MPDFQTEVRDLIAQGQLDAALQRTKQAALSGMHDLDTPVTLLLSEFEYLRRSIINGLLAPAQESIQRQNLAYRLLTLVDGVQEPATSTTAPAKTVLLFLGANPFKNLALELEREVNEISAGLTQFGQRQAFDFRAKIHVTPADLQRMLLEVSALKPRFVHFAGNAVVNHPDFGTGVIFEDEQGQPRVIGGDVLAMVLQQFPSVECVFLNTCDSGPSALAIGQHIRYAIGMNARVFDENAILFAVAFYEAIAGGHDVPFAFDFARARLMMGPYPEQASLPILVTNGVSNGPAFVPGDSHLGQVNPRIMR